MTTSERINALADLFEKEGSWIQGFYALDQHGQVAGPSDDEATCWCVRGGILKLFHKFPHDVVDALRRHVGSIVQWNDRDGNTRENVVKTLREIAKEYENED